MIELSITNDQQKAIAMDTFDMLKQMDPLDAWGFIGEITDPVIKTTVHGLARRSGLLDGVTDDRRARYEEGEDYR